MNNMAVIARFVLATVFLTAGVAKLPRRGEFVNAVRNYGLVPERFVGLVGRLVPGGEVLLAVMLFAGIALTLAASLSGAALVIFSLAVVVNLLRGREIDCGCFGLVSERQLGWGTVVRNVILIAAAAVIVSRPVTTLSLGPVLRAGPAASQGTGFAGLLLGTVAAVAYSLARETVRLRRLLGTRS